MSTENFLQNIEWFSISFQSPGRTFRGALESGKGCKSDVPGASRSPHVRKEQKKGAITRADHAVAAKNPLLPGPQAEGLIPCWTGFPNTAPVQILFKLSTGLVPCWILLAYVGLASSVLFHGSSDSTLQRHEKPV